MPFMISILYLPSFLNPLILPIPFFKSPTYPIPSNPLSFPTCNPLLPILPYPWVLFRTLKFLQKRIIDKQFIFDHPSDHDSNIPIKNPFHQFSCSLHYHNGGLELKNVLFQSIRKWCTNLFKYFFLPKNDRATTVPILKNHRFQTPFEIRKHNSNISPWMFYIMWCLCWGG